MKRWILVIAVTGAVLAACLAVVGCAPSADDGTATNGTTTDGTRTNPEPPGPLELSEADSGSTQELQTGQLVVITLDANPSTGYEWQVDGAVPAQLTQSGEPEFEPESDAIGAGGEELWTFRASETGQGTLKMIWSRPWEEGVAPKRTFEVNVSVR